MRLNKIQSLCLFKGTSPKVSRASKPAVSYTQRLSPCPLFLSLSLLLGVLYTPFLGHTSQKVLHPEEFGCLFFASFQHLVVAHSKKKLQRREKEDQREKSSVDRNPGFVQIQQAEFWRSKIQIKEDCSRLILSRYSQRSDTCIAKREPLLFQIQFLRKRLRNRYVI